MIVGGLPMLFGGAVAPIVYSGLLKNIASSTVATGNAPQGMAVHPNGLYAYVANVLDNTISQYTLDGLGAPTAMSPATVTTTAAEPLEIRIHPNGDYLYVCCVSGLAVAQFSIGGDGKLTALSPATVTSGTGANGPYGIEITPSGSHFYACNYTNGTVSQWSVGVDGKLTPLSTFTIACGTLPQSVAINAAGTYLYVANGATDNISQYSINAGTGQLAALSPATVAAGDTPEILKFSPQGFLYCTNYTSGTISVYSVAGSGQLVLVETGSATAGVTGVAFNSAGTQMYATAALDADLGALGVCRMYNVDTSTGALTAMTPDRIFLPGAKRGLAMHPNDAWLYCTGLDFDTLMQFSRNGTATTVSVDIAASADDGLWNTRVGTWADSGTELDVGGWSTPAETYHVSFRFINTGIPQGATIATAMFTIQANATQPAKNYDILIRGDDVDNCPALSASHCMGNGWTNTGYTVKWRVGSITIGSNYSRTVAAVVQEVVDRAGFGGNIGISLDGSNFPQSGSTNYYAFRSFDHANANSEPQLDVTYIV